MRFNCLKTRAAEFGIDPERLALAGLSAGDQLDLLTAYASRDPAIKGVVAWCAPTDRAIAYQASQRAGGHQYSGIPQNLSRHVS